MSRSRSKTGIGKILLWIFLFPIMITVAIGRSKMKTLPKVLIILLIWALVIGAGSRVSKEKTDNNATSNTTQTKEITGETEGKPSESSKTKETESKTGSSLEVGTPEKIEPEVENSKKGYESEDADNPETSMPLINTEIPNTPIPDIPDNTVDDIPVMEFMDAPFLKGRGLTDIAGVEPNYIGCAGYASVYTNSALEDNADYTVIPWNVPLYNKAGQSWENIGTIEHKTKIGIIGQNLTKKNAKEYEGYLEFQSLETGVMGYIDVTNFVTSPYWEENAAAAVEKGYGIATFKQNSKFNPIYQNGNKAVISEGTQILLPAKGTYYISVSDKVNYPIVGIVFAEKNGKMEAHYVFFNRNDITLIY